MHTIFGKRQWFSKGMQNDINMWTLTIAWSSEELRNLNHLSHPLIAIKGIFNLSHLKRKANAEDQKEINNTSS